MGLIEDAHVTVMVGDYVGVDAANKLNVIGGGFLIAGLQGTGLIAPQHIAVAVTAPGRYTGTEFDLTIELRNSDTNSAVQLPGPTGQLEALRISQIVKFPRTELPGVHIPEHVPTQVQFVMAFPAGLPLAPEHTYEWRVEVNGQRRKGWVAQFYVPGPPPPPVFGGPSNPTDPAHLPSTVVDDPIEGPDPS